MEIKDADFQKEVLENEKLVVVDFWAPWCGPCQMLKPMIEGLAEEVKEKADVRTMNVDESQKTAGEYNIRSIPAVLFFKNGEVVKEMIGMQSKESYIQAIDELNA
jgi:thioredoxin 1